MKTKIPILFILFFTLNVSSAQSLWLQTGFSYATAEYKYQDHDLLDDETFKPRFQIGALAELPVTPIFSVNPGLILQTKGTYESYETLDPESKAGSEINLWYFDIPVLLNLKIPFDKFGLFIEMGPYAGIGLSGNAKYYDNINEPFNEKDKFKWGKDEDLKRMEYGIMGGTGAEINRFKFGLSYTYSMRNVTNADDYAYKNRVLTLFVSYSVLRNTKN